LNVVDLVEQKGADVSGHHSEQRLAAEAARACEPMGS
jgi:hypothetical protein